MGHPVSGTKRLTAVTRSKLFSIGKRRVQPSRSDSFPWVSTIAKLYEEYKLERLQYTFVPTVSSFTNGRIAMCYVADPLSRTPPNMQAMLARRGAVTSPVRQQCTLNAAHDHEVRYVEHDDDVTYNGAGHPLNTLDNGVFFFGVEGVTNGDTLDLPDDTIIGYIDVTYTIRFFQPRLDLDNEPESLAGYVSQITPVGYGIVNDLHASKVALDHAKVNPVFDAPQPIPFEVDGVQYDAYEELRKLTGAPEEATPAEILQAGDNNYVHNDQSSFYQYMTQLVPSPASAAKVMNAITIAVRARNLFLRSFFPPGDPLGHRIAMKVQEFEDAVGGLTNVRLAQWSALSGSNADIDNLDYFQDLNDWGGPSFSSWNSRRLNAEPNVLLADMMNATDTTLNGDLISLLGGDTVQDWRNTLTSLVDYDDWVQAGSQPISQLRKTQLSRVVPVADSGTAQLVTDNSGFLALANMFFIGRGKEIFAYPQNVVIEITFDWEHSNTWNSHRFSSVNFHLFAGSGPIDLDSLNTWTGITIDPGADAQIYAYEHPDNATGTTKIAVELSATTYATEFAAIAALSNPHFAWYAGLSNNSSTFRSYGQKAQTIIRTDVLSLVPNPPGSNATAKESTTAFHV